MYLYKLRIENFKRLKKIEVKFGETSFIIGENNSGKSSVLQAIEQLLSGEKKLADEYFHSELESESKVSIEAEFRNLPIDSLNWRGFKGRILNYSIEDDSNETGLYCIYRKTFEKGKDFISEMYAHNRILKEKFSSFKTVREFIDNGVSEELFNQVGLQSFEKTLNKSDREKLELINDIWEIDSTNEPEWFANPGGIAANVLSKLPKYILVPAHASSEELSAQKGALHATLNELFVDVRSKSENFKEAQKYLTLLAEEFDPDNSKSELGGMISELNGILSGVFPESKLHVSANLSEPDDVIKPKFDVEMSSNVRTKIEHQGTGMIRSAVFGMLRYREQQQLRNMRPLIIGFEEPELYLHPNAANQMKNALYDLSSSSLQIISTTHSPYFVDLSRNLTTQVINSFSKASTGEIVNIAFNLTSEFKKIQEDDKAHLKMLLSIDDRVARVFFVQNVVIVEGNTEEVVLKESLKLLKENISKKSIYDEIIANFEIVNARGKATIIGLVKYLTAMGIQPIVIHDRDDGVKGAEIFNTPIAVALNGSGRIIQVEKEIEHILGYKASLSEKPYRAFKKMQEYQKWENLPEDLVELLKDIFKGYLD